MEGSRLYIGTGKKIEELQKWNRSVHSENKYYYTESIKINENVLQINTYCKDRNDFY